jgi:hypothetical protein
MKHFQYKNLRFCAGKNEEQCPLAHDVILCSLVYTRCFTSSGHYCHEMISWVSVITKGPINTVSTLNSYCSMEVFLIVVSKLQ